MRVIVTEVYRIVEHHFRSTGGSCGGYGLGQLKELEANPGCFLEPSEFLDSRLGPVLHRYARIDL